MASVLKLGSKGEEVKKLQRLLACYPDGIFGEITLEAVLDFQKTHKDEQGNPLVADGIVGQKTWAALEKDKSMTIAPQSAGSLKKSKRSINEIIVHCTATIEGKNYTVANIRNWHLKRGFSDIGYHYLIYLDGSVNEGRNVNLSGAHTKYHNAHSIGVCYVGGLDKNHKAKDTRTKEQKESMLKLLKDLKKLYPKATIHGHYEFANKACPCFKPKEEYKDL